MYAVIVSKHLIILQFWAKAVDTEVSCMILTSGTEEVVCLRERGSQTLWISETLEVGRSGGSHPPYVKLHAAVNIAGFKDGCIRAEMIKELMAVGGLPASFRESLDESVDATDSRTSLADKKALYRASMGKLLPPRLSVSYSPSRSYLDLICFARIRSSNGIQPQ